MIQTLTGDRADNIEGLVGVGPVSAEKILGDTQSLNEMWNKVVEAYKKKKKTYADAVMTARSLSVISLLANEDIPVMGHLGLVPRKCSWVGGVRAVGKTSDEAFALFQKFRRLEDAGAFSVEAEVIPARVMEEISKRTGLVTVSIGSGQGGDVIYLFMEDICGEHEKAPKHARSFGNIYKLNELIKEERLSALKKFQHSSAVGEYPSEKEIAIIEDNEYESFQKKLNS